MKPIRRLYFVVILFGVFSPNLFAETYNSKIGTRDSHQDVSHSLLLEAISANNLSLELNTEKTLSVRLLANDLPLSSANVTWQITQTNTANTSQSASFIIDGTDGSTLEVLATDDSGISEIILHSGEIAASYTITALATVNLSDSQSVVTLQQTFKIVAGIQESIIVETPEYQMAVSFSNLCPQLQEDIGELNSQQLALLDRCNEIQQAISEGKSLEVSRVLREISPEELAVQSQVGSNFTNQQISNIASRLGAVRKGTSTTSFSQLGFRYKGQAIPLNYMLNSLLSAVESDSSLPGGLLGNRLGLFANGNLSLGERSATAREDGFEFDNYGLTLGADYRVKRSTFIGAALGISKSEVAISNKGGDMDTTGLSLNIYGSHYVNDRFYVDGVLNLGNNQYEMKRHINYTLSGNNVSRTASSDTNGLQNGISAGGGYEFNDGALSATVFGNINYTNVNIDGFTETGAQELNLKIQKQNFDSLTSSVGAQLSYTHSARWGIIIPFIGFTWEHEYSGESDTISGAFVDDQYDSSFDISTEKADSNYFTNVQGISFVLPRGVSAYIRMENILGKDFYSISNLSFGGRFELAF